MAAIAATNVTHLVEVARVASPGRVMRRVKITFGDGALTYPAGGIPLTLGQLGCRAAVNSIKVLGRAVVTGEENAVYEWNGSATAPKLVALECNTADAPDAEVDSTYAPAAQTLYLEVEGY